MGICCVAQGTQTRALEPRGWDGQGGGGGSSGVRGHMYTYGQFMLLFGKNQHSSVKQLSFN